MNKHEAIRETHNTVVTIRGNDQSDIVAFDDSGNSVTIDWTKVNNHITSNEYKEKKTSRVSINLRICRGIHRKRNRW